MGTDVSYLQSFAPTASVYLPTIQFVMFPPRTKQRSVDNENNYNNFGSMEFYIRKMELNRSCLKSIILN